MQEKDIQDEINGYERSGEGEGNGEVRSVTSPQKCLLYIPHSVDPLVHIATSVG